MCGTPIYIPKGRLKAVNFCSNECLNLYQGRNKIRYVCKICRKAFWWSPSRETSQTPKYCSVKCRTSCPEWKRKSVIAGNLKQQNRKAPSSLEIAGSKILEEIGVKFSTQVLIAEKFTVDALLDGRKIVVQWDGDYWHGFKKPNDARQRKRIALDKSQDAYMRKCGYTVLRFWEHEVKNNKEMVCENIKRAIQFATA
jgi:very-short-patch-repair endonuclease